MRTQLPRLVGEARHRAERSFGAHQLHRRLAEAPADPPAEGVLASEIVRAVLGGDRRLLARVRSIVLRDPGLLKLYNACLRRSALAVMEQAAAASSGEIGMREIGGYWLEVRTSGVRPDRAYVVIHVNGAVAPPKALEILEGHLLEVPLPAEATHLELPPPEDGIIQIVLDAQDPVVRALKDPRVVIVLLS